MTLEELQVIISAQTSQFRSEINNVQRQVNTLNTNVNRQISSINNSVSRGTSGIANVFKGLKRTLIALGIGKVIKDSIVSGMEAIENENLVEATFGSMTNDIKAWSNELQNSLGLNANTVSKNAGVLFNISKNMGAASDTSLDLSKNLTLLAEDMASFYNLDSDETFNKIRSGLTGETEPLKALGILVDENTLKQYGYNSSMSNAEKIMVRYKAILAQTGTAQGDLARTLNSPANQLRILKNNLSMLKIELGKAFMPIVQVVLPILNGFVQGLTKATQSVRIFFNTLFGTSTSAQVSGLGSLTNTTIGYNDALADTGSTAKKTKKDLDKLIGGFDEINKLGSKDDNDSSSTDIGGSVGNVGTGTVDVDTTPAEGKISEFANKLKTLFQPCIESFANLKESLGNTLSIVGDNLKWFWDNILVPFGKWTISKAIPVFFDLLSGALDVLNPIAKSFSDVSHWIWEEFLLPIASWTGGVIIDVLNGLADVLKDIGKWMDEHKTVMETIAIVIESIAISIGLVKGALLIYNGVVAITQAISWLATYGTTALGVAMLTLTNPIVLVTAAIAAVIAIVLLLIKHWDTVKEVASKVWEGIKNCWNSAGSWFKSRVVDPIANFFKGMWEGIKNATASAWNWICNLFSKGGKIFNGVVGAIGDVFKKIVNCILRGINKVISAPFNTINGLLNRIRGFDIPIVGKVFSGLWGENPLPVPQIPKLAKGGVVDKPTLALFGEAGKEVVMPLENNTGWIDNMANKIALNINSSNSTQPINLTAPIYLGDELLTKKIIKNIKQENRRTGGGFSYV